MDIKRELWTTFCPQKIIWELTVVETKGRSPRNDWINKIEVIKKSLVLLKKNGISGIRLAIFPSELFLKQKSLQWQPVETMLTLCKEQGLQVNFCLGPFQYPYYPGIYLPEFILQQVNPTYEFLDSDPSLYSFGMQFLQMQLEKFAGSKLIHSFHFANEWPDKQRISGKENIRIGISEAFMLSAARLIKQNTQKIITMNTNIDCGDKKKLRKTFSSVLGSLGEQGKLGFDIYPSQESWMHTPIQKMRRIFETYHQSFAWCQEQFDPCDIYFTEVEAQPWGDGRSWYEIIKTEPEPRERVLTYSNNSLQKTWETHIAETSCKMVSLWGSDFWLSSAAMGLEWPLENVARLSKNY